MRLKLLKNKEKLQKNNTDSNANTHEKTRDKQRGRSMVEMLGVLAIIGVLSIGGIAGYTIAMRRYRANEILNVATKYALILYSNCQNAMMNDNSSYYTVSESRHGEGRNWNCPKYIPFTNAGLGGLPSGASQIVVNKMNYFDTDSTSYIVTTQSGDYVGLRVTFDSKELCQTASTMVGKEEGVYSSTSGPQPCDDNVLVFSVPVN